MRFFLLFTFLFCPLLVIAQSNYQKGSVTITKDKVLRGYIDHREWATNPKQINFKVYPNDTKFIKYDPSGIESFTIDDIADYQVYRGNVSMNKLQFPDIPYELDSTVKNVSVFLKVVAKGGYINLLSYTDELKTRFFIQEKNKQPNELIYQKYYITGGSVKTDNRYISQLIGIIGTYAPSKEALMDKVQEVRYDENDLITIVNMINGVDELKRKANGTINKTKRSNFRLFAGGAVSVGNSYITGLPALENGKGMTYTPQIDLGFDLFTEPSVQKFAFRLAVSLNYINPVIKAQNSFTTLSLSKYTLNGTYSYKQYNIRLIPQFIYNVYNGKDIQFYVDAGLAANFSKYSNQTFTVSNNLDPTYGVAPESNYTPYDLEGRWFTGSFQTGVIFTKRFEVYFNYIMPTSYKTILGEVGLKTAYYDTGVHYLLGKKH